MDIPAMQNQQPTPPGNPVYISPEDEISLIDLWLIIARRKKIFWGVFGFFMAAGLIFALTKTKQYEVTTVIEIGATVQDGKLTPLKTPNSVKVKLEHALIPKILNAGNADGKHTAITTTVLKNSNIILLKSKATDDKVNKTAETHAEIVSALTNVHDRILRLYRQKIAAGLFRAKSELELLKDQRSTNAQRKTIESQLKKASIKLAQLQDTTIQKHKRKSFEVQLENEKNRLESLKSKEMVLYSKSERVNTSSKLLKGQIEDLKHHISEAIQQKKRSIKDTKEAAQAMALLMIDNEIQQNRNRLSTLEERLYVGIENQRSDLTRNIEENLRQQKHQISLIDQKQQNIGRYLRENTLAQENQVSGIAQIRAKLDKFEIDQKQKIQIKTEQVNELNNRLSNLIETKAITPPLRSQNPVGTSGKLILTLSGILGIMLGLFSTFIAEFLSKARTRIEEAEAESSQIS